MTIEAIQFEKIIMDLTNNAIQELIIAPDANLWFPTMPHIQMARLASALQRNTSLINLSFAKNYNIGVSGAQTLAVALLYNTRLRSLEFHANSIGDDGVTAIAEAIAQSLGSNISRLVFVNCNLGYKAAQALAKAIDHSRLSFLQSGPFDTHEWDTVTPLGALALIRAQERKPQMRFNRIDFLRDLSLLGIQQEIREKQMLFALTAARQIEITKRAEADAQRAPTTMQQPVMFSLPSAQTAQVHLVTAFAVKDDGMESAPEAVIVGGDQLSHAGIKSDNPPPSAPPRPFSSF